jgi:hypothetical protein
LPSDPGQRSATGERYLDPLLRRRRASLRCPPLACDGRRDPLDPPPRRWWSARERASWRLAWVHLAERGLRPVVPTEVYDDPDRWGDAA